ncbi:unnamed protein product (macronuclear) [Paramecium tetraurelia]|uniref:Uncharacterized protein n=1 Tax=Paramecium tetraurelia TaxID=5888 RepID=A0DZQ0_PARTE|nr:uncharacterized protein GSPATT00021685001 [Paramecium tetraurelia]CAK88517.1 unnamed protein product [Paramecium tetraurelia]|eukprot:XP_001455914.1 hypothetical protein (macronuclear) [Paramecium tetraurelia strain d4-2]
MQEQQNPHSIKKQQKEEKMKKLLMKMALNILRKFFNSKGLPYHPLITCVSIKPGCPNRCASLQSYPNQSVWKSLIELPKNIQKEVADFLTKELQDKQQKFSQNFLVEACIRINNSFDFSSFYKEPTLSNNQTDQIEQDIQGGEANENMDNGIKIKQKKWSKGQDFVSESKQISTQMKLCNQHPPLVKVNQTHYHKMRTLLEKIKDQKFKWSKEMKVFVEELEKFIQNDPSNESLKPKKKIKKSNDKKECQQQEDDESIQRSKTILNDIKQEENSAQDFLEQFKQQIKQIEPGIVMYLPEYSKISPQYYSYCKNLEDDYFKELYYMVRVEEMVLNPQNILRTVKQCPWNHNSLYPFKVEHEAQMK